MVEENRITTRAVRFIECTSSEDGFAKLRNQKLLTAKDAKGPAKIAEKITREFSRRRSAAGKR
jgi:hypothetical protein